MRNDSNKRFRFAFFVVARTPKIFKKFEKKDLKKKKTGMQNLPHV